MWIRNTASDPGIQKYVVGDPDPGPGAFLTPGSEIRDPKYVFPEIFCYLWLQKKA